MTFAFVRSDDRLAVILHWHMHWHWHIDAPYKNCDKWELWKINQWSQEHVPVLYILSDHRKFLEMYVYTNEATDFISYLFGNGLFSTINNSRVEWSIFGLCLEPDLQNEEKKVIRIRKYPPFQRKKMPTIILNATYCLSLKTVKSLFRNLLPLELAAYFMPCTKDFGKVCYPKSLDLWYQHWKEWLVSPEISKHSKSV